MKIVSNTFSITITAGLRGTMSVLLLILVLVFVTGQAWGATLTAKPSNLQSVMNSAACGDTIILEDGTYTGTYNTTNAANCTNANPITIQASNLHQADFVGPGTCSSSATFTVNKQGWRFHGLRIRNRYQAFSLTAAAHHTQIHHTLMHDLLNRSIAATASDYGPNDVVVKDSVMAFTDACETANLQQGNVQIHNADRLTVINTAFVGIGAGDPSDTRPDGLGHRRQPVVYAHTGHEDGLFQGNLVLGSVSTVRFFGSATQPRMNRNTFKDSIFSLVDSWGAVTDDCTDDDTLLENNIFFRTRGGFQTKGNQNGIHGGHVIRNNAFLRDELSWQHLTFGGGGCGGTKINQTLRDNVFYSYTRTGGNGNTLIGGSGLGAAPGAFSLYGHNLFFAEGSTQSSAVVGGYQYAATDVWARPIFNDPTNGDFSLHSSSPMKGRASTGLDPGISYNDFLRRSVMIEVVGITNQMQEESVSGTTSVRFSGLDPNRHYFLWAYYPEPTLSSEERVSVNGTHVTTIDTSVPYYNCCLQSVGPSRWRSVYRSKPATNGTLTVSWQRAGYFGAMRAYPLPTANEAYAWMNGNAGGPETSPSLLPAPTNVKAVVQ